MPAQTKELKTLYKKQTMLQLLTFTMITVFIWVSFSLFRSQRESAISAEQKNLAKSLTPNINTEVLNQLENKNQYSEAELGQFPIYKIKIEEVQTRRSATTQTQEETSEIESSIPVDLGAIILQQEEPTETASPAGEAQQ